MWYVAIPAARTPPRACPPFFNGADTGARRGAPWRESRTTRSRGGEGDRPAGSGPAREVVAQGIRCVRAGRLGGRRVPRRCGAIGRVGPRVPRTARLWKHPDGPPSRAARIACPLGELETRDPIHRAWIGWG